MPLLQSRKPMRLQSDGHSILHVAPNQPPLAVDTGPPGLQLLDFSYFYPHAIRLSASEKKWNDLCAPTVLFPVPSNTLLKPMLKKTV